MGITSLLLEVKKAPSKVGISSAAIILFSIAKVSFASSRTTWRVMPGRMAVLGVMRVLFLRAKKFAEAVSKRWFWWSL